MITQRIRW